jgi:hypothetical protein
VTATNHALTGAAIGLLVGEPLIALSAALASHFVCDALPHYASATPDRTIKSAGFRNYLFVEAALCGLIVLVLAIFRPEQWFLAAACAFLAASPDFLWINRYRLQSRGRRWRPIGFLKFAADIQWFQRPIGAVVEVAWFAAMVVAIKPFLVY